MQCVILAGGLATRLKPITEAIPKSMVPVHGKPFLEYQVSLLRENGVRDIVMCVGYLSEQIVAYFGDGKLFGVRIRYSCETEKLLGTGGAITHAVPLLGDHFFVMYGDSYLDVDFGKVAAHFSKCKYPALLVVYKNEGKWDTSNVVFWNDRVVLYDKKNRVPEMNYIDYGLCILSRSLLTHLPQGTKWDLGDLYGRLANEGQLGGYEVFSRFYEIGSKEGLREFEAHVRPDVTQQI